MTTPTNTEPMTAHVYRDESGELRWDRESMIEEAYQLARTTAFSLDHLTDRQIGLEYLPALRLAAS